MLAAAAAGLEEEEEETEEEKEEAEVGTAAGARPEARLQPGMLPLPSPLVRAALSPAPREKTRPETPASAPPPEHNHNSERKSGPVVFARPPRRLRARLGATRSVSVSSSILSRWFSRAVGAQMGTPTVFTWSLRPSRL